MAYTYNDKVLEKLKEFGLSYRRDGPDYEIFYNQLNMVGPVFFQVHREVGRLSINGRSLEITIVDLEFAKHIPDFRKILTV